jgi:hypothetical protein
MTEEDLFGICQLHPGLAEALYMLRMAGFSWEDLKPGLEGFLLQQRQKLN